MRKSLFILLLLPGLLHAQLRLDKIFTDHMMLQREKRVMVRGVAKPGARVELSFKTFKGAAKAGVDSVWRIVVGPFGADARGADMTVRSGGRSLVLRDVVIGDIWLCLGQSNMEFAMQQELHYAAARAIAADSGLRLFDGSFAGQGIYGQRYSDSVMRMVNVKDFYKGRWKRSDSNSFKSMSAVGWYFGKRLRESAGVPVGLVNLAIGGAPAETFIPHEAFNKRVDNWLTNTSLPDWVRERGVQNVGNADADADHAYKPGFAFDAGLRALADFPVKGVLWYQGESNAQEPARVAEYNALQALMVRSYRQHWKDSALPFYYVQLSSIDSVKYKSQLWPWFRDEQRQFLEQVPHTGMAVSSDHGLPNDVHPREKRAVGERLARWALHDVYGKDVLVSGPLASHAVWYGGKLVIYFRHTGLGLDGDLSKGFSLDGLQTVPARINGHVVEIDRASPPDFVYYGWKPFSDGGLINSEGLPASTFKLKVDVLQAPVSADSVFGTYYQQRASLMRALPKKEGEIIFAGNSITDGGEWSDLFNDQRLSNFGISGDISAGLLNRTDDIAARKPSKLFVLIGVNDLARGLSPDSVTRNLFWIRELMRRQSPSTQVFFQSILPVNSVYGKFGGHTSKMKEIAAVNDWMREHADVYGYTYIDLHPAFADGEGKLRKELTNDGLHLLGEGYLQWKSVVYPYVTGTSVRPALIPMPRVVEWRKGSVVLQAPRMQVIPSYGPEEYDLTVSDSGILIKGGSPSALYYGQQTLKQLSVNGVGIPAVHIHDRPAFPYRGFMTDVGRNFQSVQMLKEMIDVMAMYKLNVFHLHLTEDIAWRLEVPGFPQLTSAANMTRNKGAYYSVAEIRELEAYCRERHIAFLPEIDLPGHSAAFERAMGVPMQSTEGIRLLKAVLDSVVSTYGFRKLHIGGDEVKIRDSAFLPSILAHLRAKGLDITCWDPGVVHGKDVKRQLWMRDGAVDPSVKYIDSRHAYLNHMDPLESVVTLFQRKIGDVDSASANVLGGTICVWHDRNVISEDDILRMNSVYPGMITFAERSWRGGGVQPWMAVIRDSASFAEFEQRLLDHKTIYFGDKIFPYTRQGNLSWTITSDSASVQAVGGTIVLQHFWDPLVEGALGKGYFPKGVLSKSAGTRIWSDTDTIRPFWIGFNDLSRSYATNTALAGQWNETGATVSVNGVLIPPPNWKRPGAKGDLEQPLLDEGYSYRKPTMIRLKRGWNDVVLTLPFSSAAPYGNPFKWMFTFVPL